MYALIQRSSLAQQAVDLLRERICQHEPLPGQRLDEAVLAEELGISRTPLREALKVLATEGLADLRPHRGCFIAELTLTDLADIFPIMAILEGCVASEVAKIRTPASLRILDELHDRLEKHAASGNIDHYYEANYAFHDTLQQLAGNRWLQAVIGDLRKILKLSRHRSLRMEGRLQASLQEHRALMKALHTGQPELAEQLMRAHLLAQLATLRDIMTRVEAAYEG